MNELTDGISGFKTDGKTGNKADGLSEVTSGPPMWVSLLPRSKGPGGTCVVYSRNAFSKKYQLR